MYQVQGVYLLYLTTEMAGALATPADVAISAALSAAAAAFYSAYVAAQGHAVPHLAATATALTATVRRYAGIAVERLAIVQSAGKSYAAAVDTGLDPLRGILDGFVGRVLRGDFTPTDERRVIEGYLDQLWKEVRENLRRPCAMCGCHAPCRVNVIIIITHARAHHTRTISVCFTLFLQVGDAVKGMDAEQQDRVLGALDDPSSLEEIWKRMEDLEGMMRRRKRLAPAQNERAPAIAEAPVSEGRQLPTLEELNEALRGEAVHGGAPAQQQGGRVSRVSQRQISLGDGGTDGRSPQLRAPETADRRLPAAAALGVVAGVGFQLIASLVLYCRLWRRSRVQLRGRARVDTWKSSAAVARADA